MINNDMNFEILNDQLILLLVIDILTITLIPESLK